MYLYICFMESYVFYELKENQYYVSFFTVKRYKYVITVM